MNKSLTVIFALSCVFLYSCAKKQVGFFNNRYENYHMTDASPDNSKRNSADIASEKITASNDKSIAPLDESDVKKIDPSVFNSAPTTKKLADNNSLENPNKKISKQERKEIRKMVKSQLKNDRSGMSTLLLVIFAILLPPLAVGLVDGLSAPFWLSILLTLLFYVPGLIYALFRIFRTEK